jgi:hypothetical protein
MRDAVRAALVERYGSVRGPAWPWTWTRHHHVDG